MILVLKKHDLTIGISLHPSYVLYVKIPTAKLSGEAIVVFVLVIYINTKTNKFGWSFILYLTLYRTVNCVIY